MVASKSTAGANPVQIPAQTQASKALERRERYQGTLPFTQMPRLSALVAAPAGELHVELVAERGVDGADWLRGNIRGVLPLTCQRGLHPFEWTCDVAVELRLVFSEDEEERLLKDCEPYLVRDDQLPLREMVEDEVLLALPMMARCDDPDCIERLK